MLKVISSKNDSEIYSLARKEKEKAKISASFLDISIEDAIGLSQNISIFGDQSAYYIRASRESDLEHINESFVVSLNNSEHFFVLVGSGVDFEKQVSEAGGKVMKIEERRTFDFPSELVAAIQKHDKKNSWSLLLKELEKKEAEPTHGSCIFAYKSLMVYMNDPKKNSPNSGVKDFSWKQAATNAKLGKREREEVMNKYFALIENYHKARMGKGDLSKQLESWVLEN